jgi:DNA-binding MarR family transcriptional regulator
MDTSICFNLALRKSTRLLTQFYEGWFNQLGLKVGQFSILRAVHYCKVTNNKQLQSILVIDQTTLSRNLKPLIRDGLLTLSPDPDDQRIKNISLSDQGEALYQEALPLWQSAQQELVKKLGEDNAQNILNLSSLVVESFKTG